MNYEWFDSGLESLKGQTVTNVLIGKSCNYDNHDLFDNLKFVCEDGDFCYSLEGDCCSTSWLYSIDGLNKILGKKILKIIDIDTSHINLDDGLGTQSYDQVYGIGLVTKSGICNIIYRNSSNGYYGGTICRIKNIDVPLQELKEDFLRTK